MHMKITIKKQTDGKWNVYTPKRELILQIEDLYPHIKQTYNKPKSFFLWVRQGPTIYKHKISWFYSITAVKQWLKESIDQLGFDVWVWSNGLTQAQNNKQILTVKTITKES